MTGDRRTKTALASGPAPGTGGDRRFAGRRALVVGLGVEGVALTRFLVTAGATVTVNDARREDQLGDRLAQLEDVPFMRALGGHDPALVTGADLLFVSQGVPLTQPIVREARRRGLPVGSVATLLFEICAGQILGVTGSAGKTTTTALVAAIVARSERPHLLAGNIGSWPLAELARATPETLVVTEISHTQLQLITRGPSVACVTNVTPNHLDQFDWDAYVDLKRTLVRYQRPEDTAVLNLDNAVTRSFSGDTDAEALWFSMGDALPGDGTFLSGERLLWRRRGRDVHVIDTTEILLPGRHNVENVLAATAVAGAAGIPMEYVREAVRAFHGVPHRLEVVATHNRVTFVNDSIATAPERTLAGMRSFDQPLVLLLGGRDKNLPLEELAAEAARRCRAVICFGEAGDLFAGAMHHGGARVQRVATLDDALACAVAAAAPDDVVLLAPAGTSFDAYPNFERRGDHFRALVHALGQRSTDRADGSLPQPKEGSDGVDSSSP